MHSFVTTNIFLFTLINKFIKMADEWFAEKEAMWPVSILCSNTSIT